MPDPTAAPAVEVPPDTDPAIRTIAMPADTNPHGDIFGGWLLCQMDLAGASVAVRRVGGRVVTVAITAMAFHRPVCVGDQVSCYGSVEKIGTTSITVKVESWALRGTGTTPIKVTEGLFTYVRVVPTAGRSRSAPADGARDGLKLAAAGLLVGTLQTVNIRTRHPRMPAFASGRFMTRVSYGQRAPGARSRWPAVGPVGP